MHNHGFPLNRCKCGCTFADRPRKVLTLDATRMLPYRAAIGNGAPDPVPAGPQFNLQPVLIELGDAAQPTAENLVLLNHTLPADGWTLRGRAVDAGAIGSECGLAFGYHIGGTNNSTPYYSVAGYRTGATTHEVFIRRPDGQEVSRPCPRATGEITIWRRGVWVFASFGSVTNFTYSGVTYTGRIQFGINAVETGHPLAFGLYSRGRRTPDFLEGRYHNLGIDAASLHGECAPLGHWSSPENNLMRGFGVPIGLPQTIDGTQLVVMAQDRAYTAQKSGFGGLEFFGLVSEDPPKEHWRIWRTIEHPYQDKPWTPGSNPVHDQAMQAIGANGGSAIYGGSPPTFLMSGVARFTYYGQIEIDANPDTPPGHQVLTIPAAINPAVNPATGLTAWEAVNAFLGSSFAGVHDAVAEFDEQ